VALLGVAAHPSHAQEPDVAALLNGAATALADVQRMRFSIAQTTGTQPASQAPSGDGAPAAGISSSLSVSGAFQAPDRTQVTLSMGAQPPVETVMIGRIWTRGADGRWRRAGAVSSAVDPALLASVLREIPSYLIEPARVEGTDVQRISATVDLARASTDGAAIGHLFGGSALIMSNAQFTQGPGRIVVEIDRASGYPVKLSGETSFSRGGQSLPTGALGGLDLSGGSFSLNLTIGLSDFDSPSVQIDPPM
jgi:hypothetical protein